MSSTEVPEWVLWIGHPSPYLVKYWLGVALAVVLGEAIAVLRLLPQRWRWIGWLVIGAGLAVGLYAALVHRSVRYVVTTEKVYKKTGLIRTVVETVRLSRVQNATVAQSVAQRLPDCGDLTIVTAGAGSSGIVFRSVPRPSTVNGLLTGHSGGDRAQPQSE